MQAHEATHKEPEPFRVLFFVWVRVFAWSIFLLCANLLGFDLDKIDDYYRNEAQTSHSLFTACCLLL